MDASYTRKILVATSPSAAYQALTTDFDKWWTTDCSAISQPGDEITFKFDATYWVMCATRLIANELVELVCTEAHHEHSGLDSSILHEWEGTRLVWEISQQDGKTQITLTHDGLVPSLNCFEICKQGWDYFFAESLKQYLNTGKGSPYHNEDN